MRLRGESNGIAGVRVRGRRGLKPVTAAVFAVMILCVAALLPATALAATADAYEPDGSYLLATPITVGAVAQQHSIYPEDDVDWVAITVEAGLSYAIETAAGAVPEDPNTELRLFDSDGVTMLDYAFAGVDEYPRLEFTADADEILYAKVQGWYEGTYAISARLIGDAYEPDGSVTTASPIVVGADPQQHSIEPYDDEDWVSFAIEAGWRYAIETAPGTTVEDPDTVLSLYDTDGTTRIAIDDDGGTGYCSWIEYEAEADKTVYVMVRGWSTGTYALSVTRTPILKIGVDPASLDFGEVAVGGSLQRTIAVENQGVAPLDVGSVELTGAGFSIVRDEAGDATIPVGGSCEIDVVYTPTFAYTGEPEAVAHEWTSLIAEYNYSGAVLTSVSLYTGFRNEGGAGSLGWHVRIGAGDWAGSGAVVAGGKYNMRVVVSAGSGSLVEVLEPVGDSFSVSQTGSTVQGVAYLRVPDAVLTIASNDDDEPTKDVGLFGVAVPAGSTDTTPPTTSVSGADDLWHNADVTLTFTAVDDEGGSGMVGGEAKTEYRVDGGDWTTGTTCTVPAAGDHSWDGTHTVYYRSTDADGNTETAKSVTVKIDTTSPAGTFVLDGDAESTSSLTVSGDSDVSEPNGPVQMRFSTDDGATWTGWEAYAASAELTLPAGAGTKTVFAQYRDAAGNVLGLSDSIEVVPESPDPSLLELTAAATIVAYKGTTTLTVNLTDSVGTPLGGYLVDVQKSLDGVTWTTFATVASDGGTALTPALTRAMKFRAIGQGDYTHIVSPTVVVKPKVYLGAPVAPLIIKKDVAFVVYGTLKPRHSPGWNKAVKLYCYRKNLLTGVWVLKKTVWCKTIDYSTYSRYRVKIALSLRGSWKFRAYAPEDLRHAATWSSSTYRKVQ